MHEVAKLYVVGVGNVAGVVLGALAYIEHGPGRFVDAGDRRRFEVVADAGPTVYPAGQDPEHLVVPNVTALPYELGDVGGAVDDETTGAPKGTTQPSQLANCGLSAIDTEPGTCPRA